MYRCQAPEHIGNRLIGPDVASILRTVEERECVYQNAEGRVISQGREIVRTIKVCPECDMGKKTDAPVGQ